MPLAGPETHWGERLVRPVAERAAWAAAAFASGESAHSRPINASKQGFRHLNAGCGSGSIP